MHATTPAQAASLDSLPCDVVKAVVRRLDIDARRALGIYTRLRVPPALAADLSAALRRLNTAQSMVDLGRVRSAGVDRPRYRLAVDKDPFPTGPRDSTWVAWSVHWSAPDEGERRWFQELWAERAYGEGLRCESSRGDLAVGMMWDGRGASGVALVAAP